MTDHRPRSLSAPICYGLLAALGLTLFFPGLGKYGFWEPHEIKLADAARQVVETGGLARASLTLGRPPAALALIAAGFRAVDVTELGGRLPLALTMLLTLFACFYAGSALCRRRGALIGSFLVATTPGFLLSARQLTLNAPIFLGGALAVGGLCRVVRPAASTTPAGRLLGLLLGLLGLFVGAAAAGLLVGVVAPLLALTLAGALTRLGDATEPRPPLALVLLFGLVTLGLAALVATAWLHLGKYTWLVGGIPHAPNPTSNLAFSTVFRQIGFTLFPWVVLLPMACLHALAATTADEADERRPGFAGLLLVAWLMTTYVASTIQAIGVYELPAPVAPVVLLLVGAYLDDLFDSHDWQPAAALVALFGALLIGHDFFITPDHFIDAHLGETVRWPGNLGIMPGLMLGFAALFALLFAAILGLPLARDEETASRRRFATIGVSVAASLALALVTAHWVVPQCSKNLSAKALFGRSKALDPKAPIGQYRFSAAGSSFYTTGKMPTTLNSLEDLFQFLGRPEHVFVMAGSDELAAINQYSKQHGQRYFVVDDSSARFLLVTNRLDAGQLDLNPLVRFVSDTPPKPPHTTSINFEGKVELIGWDAPTSISSRQDFILRLYYKVLAPVGGTYKIFVHIEGSGTRIMGDHAPLEGRFPTQYWVPGTYITDEHVIHPSENNGTGAPPVGSYQIMTGFWAGANRLKITSGPNDNDNRARLGAMTIR